MLPTCVQEGQHQTSFLLPDSGLKVAPCFLGLPFLFLLMQLIHAWKFKEHFIVLPVYNWESYKDLWLVTSMRGSGYFDCHGHNSLNFGPIFKILVAKHISGPRPFIWCAEHPRGTWPFAPKHVLKLVHEKKKSQKLRKMNLKFDSKTFCSVAPTFT